MGKIVTIGEPLVVFVAQSEGALATVNKFVKGLGGAELNVALGMTRLGHEAVYMTTLGADVFGDFIRLEMEREGLSTAFLKMDPERPTGFYMKSKVSRGDPEIAYFRKRSAASAMSLSNLPVCEMADIDGIHITGISLALSPSMRQIQLAIVDWAQAHKKTVYFDPNLRPQLWASEADMCNVVNDVASRSDYFLPGQAEGKRLTGFDAPEDIATYYLERGTRNVVVKMGAGGAYYASEAISGYVSGVQVENVVDTVGAGDGFAVGLISALLEGMSLEASVKRGNIIGALAIQSEGDSAGLPDKATLEKTMRSYGCI